VTSPVGTPLRHTVDSLTSDALDQLYDERGRLEIANRALNTATVEALERAEQLAAAILRVQGLAEEYPVAIPTHLIDEALDQTTPELAADDRPLYTKITGMFGGPLTPPGDVPPAVPLPCNHAQLRQPHDPHRWEPQPGMRPVQCPGWQHVPAATQATEPREHCGHLAPTTLLTTRPTECVLPPGHQGSHADDRGCRWWPVPQPAKEQP
jgi:hypothetical protein